MDKLIAKILVEAQYGTYQETFEKIFGIKATKILINWVAGKNHRAAKNSLEKILPFLLKFRDKYPNLLQTNNKFLYRGIIVTEEELKKLKWERRKQNYISDYFYKPQNKLNSFTGNIGIAFNYADESFEKKKSGIPAMLIFENNGKSFLFNCKEFGRFSVDVSNFGTDDETIKIDGGGKCKIMIREEQFLLLNKDNLIKSLPNTIDKIKRNENFIPLLQQDTSRGNSISLEILLPSKLQKKFRDYVKIEGFGELSVPINWKELFEIDRNLYSKFNQTKESLQNWLSLNGVDFLKIKSYKKSDKYSYYNPGQIIIK